MRRGQVVAALAAFLLVPGCGSDSGPAPQGGCRDGDVTSQACGRCGAQTATCAGGAWGAWGACGGEGPCAAGDVGTQACGSSQGICQLGTQHRTCTQACTWGAWGDCLGGVGPAPAEICANGFDDDCDGQTDEPGCS